MFAVILSHAGLAVETAENGQEAVELFKTKRFDIVFMDIQMPVMNGYEAARLIRQIDDRVPIIGVTANAQSGEKEKCEAAGMNDYVSKPFKARDIFPFLHRYVSGKEQLESEEIAFNYEGALESFMGKKDVLHRVLDAFCQRGIEQLQRLQDYVHSGQLDDARILAHGIKGGAAHLEAQELAQAASVVEDACIDDQKKRAQLGLQSLISAFDRFSHYAQEILLKK